MSVTLQIKLNGGAPQTGGVTGAIGDVVQLTAANKSTWSGAARWEIYDYPPSFTVPSGWSTDSDGVFYALGNADPPAFTISGATNWGKYGFRVTVLDGAVLTTDDATALSIPSSGGIKSIMAGESTQFGGTREAWVKDLKADLRALAAGAGAGTVTPDPNELVRRDGAAQAYATAFIGPAAASTVVASQSGQRCDFVSANANYVFFDDTSPTPAARATLVCGSSQTDIYCTSSLGFRTRAVEHVFSARSSDAITGSITMQSLSGELVIEGKGASKPLRVTGANGASLTSVAGAASVTGAVDATVTATTGNLGLSAVAGAASIYADTNLGLTASTGNVTVTSDLNAEVASGRDVLLDHAAGRATIISEGGTQVVRAQEPQTSVTANGRRLTCSSDGTTFICSTDGPMRIQPEQSGSGAGRNVTVGGGPGQTPGTHLAGNTEVDLGTPVSGAVAKCAFLTSAGELGAIDAGFTNFLRIASSRTNAGLLLYGTASGAGVAAAGNMFVTLQAQAGTGHVTAAATSHRTQNQGSIETMRNTPGRAIVASATTTALQSWAIPTNEGVTIEAIVTVTNRTSKRTSTFHLRFTAQNNAGTGSDNGAAIVIGTNSVASGETTLDVTLTRSTTSVVLSGVTPDADSREFRWNFFTYPAALVA